ncbi:MAG: cupredoxin domain-containing protein [Actinomycetota bacterium]
MSRNKPLVHAIVAATLLFAAACAGNDAGESGPAQPGVRTVRIVALDSLKFDPASVAVSSGETVRFVVTNSGMGHHEFVLGSHEVQEMHEGQMGEGGHMGHGEALAALDLLSGQTKEATVTFEDPGEILYGCHIEGHYDAGMVGTVTVTGS